MWKKKSILLGLILISQFSFGRSINFDVETRSPLSVCQNTKKLISLMSPYIDAELSRCESEHISTTVLGNKEYLVNIQVESTVKTCQSEENLAIMFDIPTDTYPHWNPPYRFSYLDRILNELGLKSEISVRNIGPTSTPIYKQIVLIPKCAFK